MRESLLLIASRSVDDFSFLFIEQKNDFRASIHLVSFEILSSKSLSPGRASQHIHIEGWTLISLLTFDGEHVNEN